MKRISSESREPGMKATRNWTTESNLSADAKAAGDARRRENEELRRAELQIESIEGLIRTIDRTRRKKFT